jgi:hypothetical protein
MRLKILFLKIIVFREDTNQARTKALKTKSITLRGCFPEKIITQKKLRIVEKFGFKKIKGETTISLK